MRVYMDSAELDAQSEKKIMPHSRVCRNIVCLFEACAIDNANRMIRGKSAQTDQINTF